MPWFPPVVLPFIEPPVVVLLAAGPPAEELPPADDPLLCANANEELAASAVASAILASFIWCPLLGVRQPAGHAIVPAKRNLPRRNAGRQLARILQSLNAAILFHRVSFGEPTARIA
jgi:hypothetical protein